MVTRLAEDGPAARGGVRKGDAVLAFNGEGTMHGLSAKLSGAPGDLVELLVDRAGAQVRLQFRLEELF